MLAVSMFASLVTAQATFTPLGMPTGFVTGAALAVSADGSTVVGGSALPQLYHGSAWRWTATGGFELIPNLPGETSNEATAVSADGTTVVGWGNSPVQAPSPAPQFAFSWTPDSATVNLLPASSHAVATGVSADGTTIVGTDSAGSSAEAHKRFRMTPSNGVVYLGMLPGALNSQALRVSADGSTVVGTCYESGLQIPFRWMAATGMVGLPLPSGTSLDTNGTPSILTNDAGTVVDFAAGPHLGSNALYRWSAETGTVPITSVSNGADYVAGGMSADGSRIVGFNENIVGLHGSFLWTSNAGIVDLYNVLTANGATGFDGLAEPVCN